MIKITSLSSAYIAATSGIFTIGVITGIKALKGIVPDSYEAFQNYPNPFNPNTIIRYGLPSASKIKIAIYNLLGQQITELVNNSESAGYHEVSYNAENLSPGIYFYRISAASIDGKNNFTDTKKLILKK